jgi:hypothetical protein
VEIYDPATGAFSPQGEIVTARSSGAIFLVPGDKILLAGGATGSPLTSGPLAGLFLALDSIEIYDPATGLSTITGHMSQPRIAPGVTLADGRILVVGGRGGGAAAMATADLIDPVTGQASPPVRLVGPRASAAAILLPDNRALIVGGIDDTSGRILNSAEVYVP